MTVFAFETSSRQKGSRPDREIAPRPAKSRTGLHASALIAGACYVLGVALAITINPAAVRTLATLDGIALVLLVPYAVFLGLVAIIQRHMGVAIATCETVTPPRLCTTGVFRVTRNPIYLAVTLPLAALAALSIAAAAITITLYLVAISLFVIRGEERELATTFGAEFQAYARRTPRWLFV